jgi:hypothetical protein
MNKKQAASLFFHVDENLKRLGIRLSFYQRQTYYNERTTLQLPSIKYENYLKLSENISNRTGKDGHAAIN